jgi:hypothetical protein
LDVAEQELFPRQASGVVGNDNLQMPGSWPYTTCTQCLNVPNCEIPRIRSCQSVQIAYTNFPKCETGEHVGE